MNIDQYKKRFYNLMESTMGDVKPMLNENNSNIEGSEIVSITLSERPELSQLTISSGQRFTTRNFSWNFGPEYTSDKIKKTINFTKNNIPKGGVVRIIDNNKTYESRDGGSFTDPNKPKATTQSGPTPFNITDIVLLDASSKGAFGQTFTKTQLNGRDAIFVASQKNPGQSIYFTGDYKRYTYNTLIPGPNDQPIQTAQWTYRK